MSDSGTGGGSGWDPSRSAGPPPRPGPAGGAEGPDRHVTPIRRGWHRPDAISSTPWRRPPDHLTEGMRREVVLEAGWGRLVFGQTFSDHEQLRDVLRREASGRRDICLYLHDPHVLVANHPQEFFIDPSYTYRLWMHDHRPQADAPNGIQVHQLSNRDDAVAMNKVYVRCGMVPADVDTLWDNQRTTRHVTYLVAIDEDTGEVIGTVTGVDHARLFDDPDNGSSLWCLAVDPATTRPGVGELLVRTIVERFKSRGRAYLDLSVMHDNQPAIALYEKLGFRRVPVFGVKRKNAINERLFAPPPTDDLDHLNPYARIIADEALRRGIRVNVLDADGGYLRLEHGGRSVVTRESLSEYTSAVAMSRCDDKRVTRKVVADAGVVVPLGRTATFDRADHEFLDQVESVVVKPARGEQGQGITVGVTDHDELDRALERARTAGGDVLVETYHPGLDLRILVIDGAVSAAAVRRPATVVGNGSHSVRQLIEAQSRRRAAATDGESTIPLDENTAATVASAGWDLDDVIPEGLEIQVQRTANLHTGGTIHDVTAELSPTLADAAIRAAKGLGIPVTGIDLLVPAVNGADYVFIEANERPGLANHEPQTPAADFVDFLFPGTRPTPWAWQATKPDADVHRPGSGEAR